MESSDVELGGPGPFEVTLEDGEHSPVPMQDLQDESLPPTLYSRTIEADSPPRRRYECAHYDTCLELAAALNWSSFTCRGCSGQVNQTLMWRAGQMARKDSIAKRLCGFPKIVALRGSATKKPTVGNL